jgi:branched-subunit amino acid transport protein AzlD
MNSYLTQQVTTDVQEIHTQVATATRYTQLAFTIGWISSLVLIVLLIFSTRSVRKFFRSLGWTGFLTALFGIASLLIGKAVVLSQMPATNIPDELIRNYLTSTVTAILPLFVASLIGGIVLSLLSLIGKRR